MMDWSVSAQTTTREPHSRHTILETEHGVADDAACLVITEDGLAVLIGPLDLATGKVLHH